MLPHRVRPPIVRDLALVPAGASATSEAWVERVDRRSGRVDVRLLLDDGRTIRLRLNPDCAEWHEITPGQIVALGPSSLSRDPGLVVVSESVDVCR